MYQELHPLTTVPMLVYLTHQKLHLPFSIERLNPSKYIITVMGEKNSMQVLIQPSMSTFAMWETPTPEGEPKRVVKFPEEQTVEKFKIVVNWIE